MKWEYKRIGKKDTVSEDDLEKMGKEGWELVSAILHFPSTTEFLYFKRPLPNDHE